MKPAAFVLLACTACLCRAQQHCSEPALAAAAARVHTLQDQLKTIRGDASGDVPAAARDGLTQLKDALTNAADTALACAAPSVNPTNLQNKLSIALNALPAELDRKGSGLFGDELIADVSRPGNAGLLRINFSMNIPCGYDSILLLYALLDHEWRRLLRWQSPPLRDDSEAFGDFFVSGVLSGPEGGSDPLVVVAHGRPWCMSRHSRFAIDVLAPTADPDRPTILWHTARRYNRWGPEFVKFRISADTFELRVNDWLTTGDNLFLHEVVYRYRLGQHGDVIRIQPIATNARGFVEEWLSAPWSESLGFSDSDAAAALQSVHDQLTSHSKNGIVSHGHGPVRACTTPKTFQVRIDSDLDKATRGKPGGATERLPTRYFHVRETGDGYLMLSAPTEPDPACKGGNLMPQ